MRSTRGRLTDFFLATDNRPLATTSMKHIYAILAVSGWIWTLVTIVVLAVRWKQLRSGHEVYSADEQ